MSNRCALHDVHEAPEEVVGVVRTRAGLRVVLNAKHRLMAMLKRRNGAVVEIEVSDLNIV